MQRDYKRIEPYIRQIDIRNVEGGDKNLLGVSVSKRFMPSIANTVGTDFTKYKVVKRNQFTYISDTSRRGDKIGIALLKNYEEALVSQAYTVFEITDKSKLDPEYLMMWFRRPEFDRYARYKSHGSVREIFDWNEMCNVSLPIPSIEKQREIVAEYNTIKNRIALNNQLIQKLEETAQAIYKQWFVDFEFPDENGKPYKSSGGKMVWNVELDKEIPEGWKEIDLSHIIDVINGFAFKSYDFKEVGDIPIVKIANIAPPNVMIENAPYYSKSGNEDLSRFHIEYGDILISMTGSHMNQINSAVGKVGRYYFDKVSLLNQRVGKLKPKTNCSEFLFLFINQTDSQKHLLMGATGSANQANISPGLIKSIKLALPSQIVLDAFECKAHTISEFRSRLYGENSVLGNLGKLLLSKIATIEN